MILSVSRRTDIPNYYPEWFMKRIEESFCKAAGGHCQGKWYEHCNLCRKNKSGGLRNFP